MAAWNRKSKRIVRQHVKRGTVNVALKVHRQSAGEEYLLNLDVLDKYRKQIEQYQAEAELPQEIGIEHLLVLPGVAVETDVATNYSESAWPVVQAALIEALTRLAEFRKRGSSHVGRYGRQLPGDFRRACERCCTAPHLWRTFGFGCRSVSRRSYSSIKFRSILRI